MSSKRIRFPTVSELLTRADGKEVGDLVALDGHYKNKQHGNKPMMRKQSHSRPKPFLAYDLETTRIAVGTPLLKYITAYGADFSLSEVIKATKKNPYKHLCEILSEEFLTKRFNGYRFIAWNGNGFDVFFIAIALLESADYVIRPYLTRSKSIRGLKVIGVGKKEGLEWEFLDGMAMTGLDSAKMKLEKFVSLMAPQYPKLSLDFSQEEFDPKNKELVRYAERDSEALYYAMLRASEIMKELTGNELQPTMGNLGIKYFQSQIPEGVRIWKPNQELREVLHGPAKRGGFCWIQRQYVGPIWKYDINQCYAAAMRDAELPHGSCVRSSKFRDDKVGVYRVTISREKRSPIPFYYRELDTLAGRFTSGKPVETWIFSNEVKHLIADEWDVKIHDGYYWQSSFNMKAMVDNLERLRFSDPGGPSGALGTMVKQLGNNSYGKLLEQLGGIELVMSKTKPESDDPDRQYNFYMPDEPGLENIWFRMGDSFPKPYHQPQIGGIITSHPRLLIRSAALKAPRHFVYADTDALAFSKPVDFLKIDPKRYGDYKLEAEGDEYIFVAKKVYHGENSAEPDKPIKHAKGLMVRELTKKEFEHWFEGVPPKQQQTQRQNFVRFMAGQDMFISQDRRGTDVTKSAQAVLLDGEFLPL